MIVQRTQGIMRALACVLLTGCATADLPDFEPVNHEAGNNTVRLEPVGRYALDLFALGPAKPAAYDPQSQLLFVLAGAPGWLDFVDISNPARPKQVRRKQLLEFGGFPESVDVSRGIVAVALTSVIKSLPGQVLFFDVEGRRLGDVVRVGPQPVHLRFTPSGREIMVASQGEADDAYTIDPEGSISIVDLGIDAEDCRGAACGIEPRVVKLGFASFNDQRETLIGRGVRLYGPNASVAQDLEPEALAVTPDGETAWVSLQRNNSMAVVSLPTRRITDIFGLGAKDHAVQGNGLDASDVDGAINIRSWPVSSFYSPDIFASYSVAGQTYFVTPNEGDPRDFDGFSEHTRVQDLPLDALAFPQASTLQRSRNLGRLHVTNVDGDIDDDGDFDQLFALGSRSFSIWRTDGSLVFDSGDELEQIVATALPACFNCSSDSLDFDARSDDRGPEPETLAVGKVDERQYAFIAPERIGGVFVYDITDPSGPIFQQYINLRNFTIDPDQVCEDRRPISEECAAAGDLEPEGVLFIPATDSPIAVPLVVVTHELSMSATLYRVDRVP
jgi:2',3'-cyclic-nucleotide 2'-phosphodiesterase / 3'-nucleotidase / 5'-nucleotidase